MGLLLLLACVVVTNIGCINADGVTVVESHHQQTNSHPCDRECVNGKPMLCSYVFNVAWHYTMGETCGDCRTNSTECKKADCIPMDGRPRGVMAVNHMVPGPMIKVCHNDTIKVKVTNNMIGDEAVTIHWHGMFQRGSQYMDGTSMITQCPIVGGSSFTYKFKANPTGTHWWHAHSGIQRGEGIFGALIVKQPISEEVNADQYDIDLSEHVLMFTDWSSEMAIPRWTKLVERRSGTRVKFIGDSLLVNKLGYIDENGSNTGFRNAFKVAAGKRYRFRAVNNGVTLCPIDISVDQHILTVLSLDGADIVPYGVSNLVIRSGERMDFVISTDQPVANYWFRFSGSFRCPFSHYDYLSYDGISSDIEPTSAAWDPSNDRYKQLNPVNIKADDKHVYVTSMTPKFSKSFPDDGRLDAVPDKVHFIGTDYGHGRVVFNNVRDKRGSSPLLSQPRNIESQCDPEDEDYDISHFYNDKDNTYTCQYIIDVKLNELVELVLYDETSMTPIAGQTIHLHGQHLTVVNMDKVSMGRLNVTEVKGIYNSMKTTFKGSDSIRKDTVSVSSSGYTVVRFVADNPGVWFLHCHFGFHLVGGMSLAIRVGYPNDIPPPPKRFPTCGSWEDEDEYFIRERKNRRRKKTGKNPIKY